VELGGDVRGVVLDALDAVAGVVDVVLEDISNLDPGEEGGVVGPEDVDDGGHGVIRFHTELAFVGLGQFDEGGEGLASSQELQGRASDSEAGFEALFTKLGSAGAAHQGSGDVRRSYPPMLPIVWRSLFRECCNQMTRMSAAP
jgi:hypothetical protein